jgi:hypothetical protein
LSKVAADAAAVANPAAAAGAAAHSPSLSAPALINGSSHPMANHEDRKEVHICKRLERGRPVIMVHAKGPDNRCQSVFTIG